MAEQLGLDLPSRPALGRDAFFAGPSNAVALAMIEDWHAWPQGRLLLAGPEGTGKTHLAHVWAALSGARIVPAGTLAAEAVPTLLSGPLAVEDVDRIAGAQAAETALFHLHNLAQAEGCPLLLTGTGAPEGWPILLPDLKSRLLGAARATLAAPDDTLLAALLVKLLADRQLTPKPDLVPFLLGRMPRSAAAAIDLVARLDAASLAQKRPITRHLAAAVLDNIPPEA